MNRLTVLQSYSAGTERANPYVHLLTESLTPHVDVVEFNWRRALTGRFDIFHVHWPESLFRRDRTSVELVLKIATLALLLKCCIFGIPIVRTAHNKHPHEHQKGVLGRFVLKLVDIFSSASINLNEVGPGPAHDGCFTILHGHYRDLIRKDTLRPVRKGMILQFGLVRRYKGIENLVSAFRTIRGPQYELQISGFCSDDELVEALVRARQNDTRIRYELEYLSDDALVARISECELVVLPYESFENSGAAIMALSQDKPVLVPDNVVTRQLRDEFGADWVHLFDGAIQAHHIETSMKCIQERSEILRKPVVFGSGREWARIGEQHFEVYEWAKRKSAFARRFPFATRIWMLGR